jgi:hypothetical protein
VSHYSNTLRYWFDVEALMYPDIPKPGKRKTYTLRYTEQLPWQQKDSAKTGDNFKYFVYFGLVQKKILESELFELYRTEEDTEKFGGNHSRKANGKTFLCAIEVSGAGEPLLSTLQLAAFSTAFAGRKHQKYINYTDVLEALKTKAKELPKTSPTGATDSKWFEHVTEFLIDELKWQPRELMAREQICVHQVPLVGRDGKPLRKVPEIDPINSYYLEDIKRVLADISGGARSLQVEKYLDGERGIAKKIDVTQLDVIDGLLSASKFPIGRWPSEFPLFLMQQVAVSTSLSSLENGGIFSVNGPPGTGKTTLLMDVIAARIVDRAEILVGFENPGNAFAQSPEKFSYPQNASGKALQGSCFYVDQRLLDFGIVVASANNKAVENITLDLPNVKKVHTELLELDGEPFDYFSAAAEMILNPDKFNRSAHAEEGDERGSQDDPTTDEAEHDYIKCWGLISAPLGKKENRNYVAKCLSYFSDASIIKELDNAGPGALDWDKARTCFRRAVNDVQAIQTKIAEHDEKAKSLLAALRRLTSLQEKAEQAQAESHAAEEEAKGLDALYDEIETKLKANLAERNQYSIDWPWWRVLWARIFNKAQHLQYLERRSELEQEYGTLRSSRGDVMKQRAVAVLHAREALAAAQVAQSAVLTLEKEIKGLEARVQRLAAELGAAAFNPLRFKNLSADDREKALPRSNEDYHAKRAQVFLAALHLHKAFIKAAGKPFETNFRLALSMLEQQAFLQPILPAMAPHLWATFFLVVPVVSSTFASFSRCFRDLGKEQIGLLLVDESGQAVPSHALGPLWRSKRALIVGDPLQVEPVMPMDAKLDYEILKYHKAPEEHLLTQYSAQHLADRANAFGSYVRQYDGNDLWVGAPLRVHRRCVDPMFSIANDIAYNGKMVFGPKRQEEIKATSERPLLGHARWIDVVSNEFDEHFSEIEGNAAADIVVEFYRRGWVAKTDKLPELYVISPFKSAAEGITNLLRDRTEEWADGVSEERISNWLKSHVGTVHTFQGKESETVVFVLGGSSAGARNWAANRPNIINVAVTRAKRRLYVVGNRTHWEKTRFGEKLVKALPTSA